MSSDLHEYREFPKHDPRHIPPHYPNRLMNKDEVKEKYATTNKRFYEDRVAARQKLMEEMEEKRKAREKVAMQPKTDKARGSADAPKHTIEELAQPRYVREPFDPQKAAVPPPPKQVAVYNGALAEPRYRREPFKPEEHDRTKPPAKIPELSERQARICNLLYSNKPSYEGDLRDLIKRH